MPIADSGMAAAAASLTTSASNIAHMQSDGPVPATGPLQPAPPTTGSVYQAVSAATQTSPGGGVTPVISPTLPSYTLVYDPSAPFANLQGIVAAPNVDPATEAVNQISALAAFRANLAVFKSASKEFKALLDMLA